MSMITQKKDILKNSYRERVVINNRTVVQFHCNLELWNAIESDQDDSTVLNLLGNSSNPEFNPIYSQETSMLNMTIANKSNSLATILLNLGVRVNILNSNKQTTLYAAIATGMAINVIQLLLKLGPTYINRKCLDDDIYMVPLDKAVEMHRLSTNETYREKFQDIIDVLVMNGGTRYYLPENGVERFTFDLPNTDISTDFEKLLYIIPKASDTKDITPPAKKNSYAPVRVLTGKHRFIHHMYFYQHRERIAYNTKMYDERRRGRIHKHNRSYIKMHQLSTENVIVTSNYTCDDNDCNFKCQYMFQKIEHEKKVHNIVK